MRKLIIVAVLFMIVTFPAYKGLRHIGMISGHDADAAVFKTIEFKNALLDRHFPVRWSKRLDFGLGMPTYIFSYNLPYYLAAAISFLGLSEINSLKLIMAASFPLSGLFAWMWLKKHFSQEAAFLGGLLYAYVPYHFLNVYVRFALGEAVAGTIIPLGFWAIDRLIKKISLKNLALGALIVTLVTLGHQFYILIYGPIWIVYSIINSSKKDISKKSVITFLMILWGVITCSYLIIPAAAYLKYTYLDNPSEYFLGKNNFVTLEQLIKPSWGYEAISPQIGLVHIGLSLSAIFLLIKQKKKNSLIIFMFCLAAITVLLMLQISLPIWKMFSFLQVLQFPWRLLTIVNMATTFVGTYVISEILLRIKKHPLKIFFVVGVMAILLITNKNYWGVGRYRIWDDLSKKSIGWPGKLTLLLESTPKWHEIRQEPNPYHQSQVKQGVVAIENLIWKTNYHKFLVDSKSVSVMSDQTDFWPGWVVYVDGKKVSLIDPYDKRSEGLITFKVPPGKHLIESKLTETPLEIFADTLSAVSFLAITTCLLFSGFQKIQRVRLHR